MSEGNQEGTDAFLGYFDPRVSQAVEDGKSLEKGGSEATQSKMETEESGSKDHVRKLEDEIERLKDEIDDQNKLKHKETEILKEKIDHLKRQHREEFDRLNKSHATEIQELENENQRIRNQTARRQQAEQNPKILNDLKNENETLKVDLKEAKKQKKMLEDRAKSADFWKFGAVGLFVIVMVCLGLMFWLSHGACNIYITQISNLETTVTGMKTENNLLQNRYESVQTHFSSIEKDVTALKKYKADLEIKVIQTERKRDQLEQDKKKLEGEKTQLETERKTLRERLADLMKNSNIDELQTKLSRCLTSNDQGGVTTSDLSAIKLGQDFGVIYEQHYTMAIEELETLNGDIDVKKTVLMFLDILKMAHTLAEEYTRQHIDSMTQSTLMLEVTNPEQETQGEIKWDKVYVNGSLSSMDWKDFFEIRQKCAWRMLDSITKELGEIIARKFNVNIGAQPKMMTYIKECVGLCWKTHMHRDPVFIDFHEPKGTVEFDFGTFRPFLYQKGNYLDYIVWPPMYENRGGHMVAKGTAERKENN